MDKLPSPYPRTCEMPKRYVSPFGGVREEKWLQTLRYALPQTLNPFIIK